MRSFPIGLICLVLSACASIDQADRKVCLQQGTILRPYEQCWNWDAVRQRCLYSIKRHREVQGCVRYGCKPGYVSVGTQCKTAEEVATTEERQKATTAAVEREVGSDPKAMWQLSRSFVSPDRIDRKTYPVPQNLRKSRHYADEACAGGWPIACYDASNHALMPLDSKGKDWSRWLRLADRACNLGHVRACRELAELYAREGSGGRDYADLRRSAAPELRSFDTQTVVHYLAKGCIHGFLNAGTFDNESFMMCIRTANLFADGAKGLPKDRTKAIDFATKAWTQESWTYTRKKGGPFPPSLVRLYEKLDRPLK